MKHLLTTILYLMAIIAVAQNIEVTTESYVIGNRSICQVAYSIKNNNKESMWVWFNKEDSFPKLSVEERVRNHFMKRIKPEEPSPPILQIYMDANVEKVEYSIPDFFITVIPSGGIFTFYIIADDDFQENLVSEKITIFLKSKLCFTKESDVAKFSKDLLDDFVYNLYIYKNDAICLDWNDLITALHK